MMHTVGRSLMWVAILLAVGGLAFRLTAAWELIERGTVGMEADGDRIVRVSPGGPAERTGLRSGDRILDRNPAGPFRTGDGITYVVERNGAVLRFDMIAARGVTKPEPTLRYLLGETAMGLIFFACGLLVLAARGDLPAVLWMVYGVAMVLHGGGWPRSGPLTTGGVGFSVVMLSIMLGGTAIMHLVLLFPDRLSIADRRWIYVLLYGPLGLGAALAVTKAAFGGDSATALDYSFHTVASLHGYLFTLLAFLVLILRLVRATPESRRNDGLWIMVVGMVAATLPYLFAALLESVAPGLVSIGGLGAVPFTLLFSLIAVAFTWALLRSHRRRRFTMVMTSMV